jgi:hypothetical protein
VLILIIAAVALGFGIVVLAILAYGLFSQVKRLLRAAEEARVDLAPRLEALQARSTSGRHRA